MKPLLKAKQVAYVLQCEVQHVHKLAKAGKIPSIKIGKEWRFRESDIEEYIVKSFNPEQ